MFELKRICAGYGSKAVLQDLSLTAQPGQITVLLGPNGCGKSTLLKTICRIVPLRSGQILLDGQDLSALPQNLLAQKAAYLAQDRPIPDMTVEQYVLHGRFAYLSYPRRYRREDCLAAQEAIRQMHLTDLAQTLLAHLSGGQRQRAYVAMALAQGSDLILLDEPTASLDAAHQLEVLDLMRQLADQGKYVLAVLHDLPHALRTADQVVVMQAGKIVLQDTPDAVYASGALEDVFGVKVTRTQIEGQVQYFCGKKEGFRT